MPKASYIKVTMKDMEGTELGNLSNIGAISRRKPIHQFKSFTVKINNIPWNRNSFYLRKQFAIRHINNLPDYKDILHAVIVADFKIL